MWEHAEKNWGLGKELQHEPQVATPAEDTLATQLTDSIISHCNQRNQITKEKDNSSQAGKGMCNKKE